jgi:hypothetical protein
LSAHARKLGTSFLVVDSMLGTYAASAMRVRGTRGGGRGMGARDGRPRCGEILITVVEKDGMKGYDLALVETVVQAVEISVIESGAAGSYQHMVHAVVRAGASAVAAVSMFHFTEQTPAGAKAPLAAAGVAALMAFVADEGGD